MQASASSRRYRAVVEEVPHDDFVELRVCEAERPACEHSHAFDGGIGERLLEHFAAGKAGRAGEDAVVFRC